MNRHERRAAEAQTRSSFKSYDALYRQAFKKVDERDIGEGWMRGAAAEANGISAMIIHPTGQSAPPRDECDIELSAAYGPQRFTAYTTAAHLKTMEHQWPAFVDEVRKLPGHPLTGDLRRDTRGFVFEMIVTNQQWGPTNAALTASAIVWLAATSPVGVAVGASHKHIHYEITEMGNVDGRKAQNFRLIMT